MLQMCKQTTLKKKLLITQRNVPPNIIYSNVIYSIAEISGSGYLSLHTFSHLGM